MKTIIYKCTQCRLVKKGMRNKSKRIQTKQVRAARHQTKCLLKNLPLDEIEDRLPTRVSVDYYA